MKQIDQCGFCNSEHLIVLFSGQDRLYDQPGLFSIKTCRNCGLFLLTPQPEEDELKQYYPDNYISFSSAIQDENSWIKRLDRYYEQYKRVKNVISRSQKIGRILDVGCATGIFLNSMQNKGWEIYGVEPSLYAAKYAQERFGLPVFEGFLLDAKFQSSYFDVVSMWDVLEHVPNPIQIIEETHRILKPGGMLIISLPNPDSWECKWFGKYWAGWDIPRHLHVFSINTLQKIFFQTEFVLEETTSFMGGYGGFVLNTQFHSSTWNISPKIRALVLKFLRSLFARIIAYPFFLVAHKIKKASFMVVIARKPNKHT